MAGTGQTNFLSPQTQAGCASINRPGDILISGDYLYIAEQENHIIRRVDLETHEAVVFAGRGGIAGYSGDGGLATDALCRKPAGLAADEEGNIYFAEFDNHVIRKVELSTGLVSTVVGNGIKAFRGDGADALSASLNWPVDLVFEADGDMIVFDYGNNRLRHIDKSTNVISTLAGTGSPGNSGDGGPATVAQLHRPYSGCILGSRLIFCDAFNDRVRQIDLLSGAISSFPTSNQLIEPRMVIEGSDNALYISDQENHRIIRKDLTNGVEEVVAGGNGVGFSGDGGSATSARLRFPQGLAFDQNQNLYIADLLNNRIRRVGGVAPQPPEPPTVIASFALSPIPNPNAPLSQNCQEYSAVDLQSTTNPNATLRWFGNGDFLGVEPKLNSVPLVSGINTFTLEAQVTDGCGTDVDQAVQQLQVIPLEFVAPQDDSICLGSPGQLVAGGALSYTWTRDDGVIFSGPIIEDTPGSDTDYTLQATDENGCQFIASATIRVQESDLQPAEVEVTPSCNGLPLLRLGSTSNKKANQTGLFRLWSGQTFSVAADTIVGFPEPGTFLLEYTATDNCATQTFAQQLVVDDQLLPNVITLNGDGHNDTWRMKNPVPVEVQIFNRWGSPVFSATQEALEWGDQSLSAGVYFYLIEVLDTGQRCRGSLHVLR